MNTREWLIQNYPEVSAYDFYRDLWPKGTLDDAPEGYTPGKYNGIAVQIGDRTHKHILKDSLDNLNEILNTDDFVVISPMSYAGSSQKAIYQRYCHAIAIDVDGLKEEDGKPTGIIDLLYETEESIFKGKPFSHLPLPTYVVSSSAHNVHLYYMLDKPIPMYQSNRESLSRYKYRLTSKVWSVYITTQHDAVQQEPIGQDMRAVGSITKDGKSSVRAFKTGGKVSIDYLNRYPFPTEDTMISVWNRPDKSKAKHKQIMTQSRRPGFYEWYKKQLPTYTAEGKRYFGVMCLAIIGKKCGITREEVEQDALALVPTLDDMTTNCDNHFTKKDALNAITAYDVPHFVRMTRESLVRLSGVPMQKAKRNGRTQAMHLKILNGTNQLKRMLGEEFATGAPTKQEQVIKYLIHNPDKSNRQVAEEMGLARNTVNKWAKDWRERLEKGEISDDESFEIWRYHTLRGDFGDEARQRMLDIEQRVEDVPSEDKGDVCTQETVDV